jgi:Rrf2 family protein
MSNTNQRFSVSVHILTLLALSKDSVVTSEAIAASVDTNPVVIRRTMSHLRQRGLVDSRPGTSGGWRLVKPPDQISLCEVFHAVSHDDILSMHSHPNPECPIGGNIQKSLEEVFGKAQNAVETALSKITISDILQDVISQEGEAPL